MVPEGRIAAYLESERGMVRSRKLARRRRILELERDLRRRRRDGWKPLDVPRVDWRKPKPQLYVDTTGWRTSDAAKKVDSARPLEDAIAFALQHGLKGISISPGRHRGVRVSQVSVADNKPRWNQNAHVPTVYINPENSSIGRPIIDGLTLHGSGYELIYSGIDFSIATGGSMSIGSTGGDIMLRLDDCGMAPPEEEEQQNAFGGTGFLWWARPYGIGLHIRRGNLKLPVKEHDVYGDTCWAMIFEETEFGPSGRTHVQGGSREQSAEEYYRPNAWPGFLVHNCKGYGLHAGAGGGGGITCWGFPGIFQIDGWQMHSDTVPNEDQKKIAENRCFDVWRASNFGGVINPDGDAWATDFVSIDNVFCDYPGMTRSLGEVESAEVAYFGSIDGTCGKKWIDAPDQFVSGTIGRAFWIPGTYKRIEVRGTDVKEMPQP